MHAFTLPADCRPSKLMANFVAFIDAVGVPTFCGSWRDDPMADFPDTMEAFRLATHKFGSMMNARHGVDDKRTMALRHEGLELGIPALMELNLTSSRMRRGIEYWLDLPLSEIEWWREKYLHDPPAGILLRSAKGTMHARRN